MNHILKTLSKVEQFHVPEMIGNRVFENDWCLARKIPGESWQEESLIKMVSVRRFFLCRFIIAARMSFLSINRTACCRLFYSLSDVLFLGNF